MKSKQTYTLLLVFASLMALYILVVALQPQKPDWEDSFSRNDKIPYGAFVLYESLEDLFPQSEIREVKKRVFNQLFYPRYHDDELPASTAYLFINDRFDADGQDLDELYYFAEAGNYVWVAARYFPIEMEDTLGFSTKSNWGMGDSTASRFYNPLLQEVKGYHYEVGNMYDYFDIEDTLNISVLACNSVGQPNLIRVPFGEGAFLLSSTPNMFTNVHLLHENNHEFVAAALSYVPANYTLWWDEYYKVRYQKELEMARSSLQYIKSQESLWWAYRLIIWGILLYVLFAVKRRQRVIPVVEPLPNSTLEFTETIGRLYFQSRDHKNIAEKQIKIFLANIRARYFLKTHSFTDEFMKKLAAKSGVPEEEVIALCHYIDRIRGQQSVSEASLIALNEQIEAFYEKSGGRT
ncbi:MAG: DUF4350 domain-containing protein [Bacteroidetes bacterium]|nr:MAG: DUF4350 domain-containing protein [Bacteroidota bacterium]